MSQKSLFDLAPQRHIWKVSELTEQISALLEGAFRDVWIEGEVSNYHAAQSGHLYFTLKDARAQIRCVCFRDQVRGLKFRPEDGLHITVRGSLGVYEPRGEYQVYVSYIEPVGLGALQLAFEQLKNRLAAEGLFAPERKRSLPFLPEAIGIVTSGRGAALHDMLRILNDRFPDRRVVLRPVKVQGEGAGREIAEAIADLNRFGAVDVIIAGRGGGSLEDLWAFNEEVVARAIFASAIPIVSAVGHEIDFTIADFVADRRAPTPTAAAEMVVPRKTDLTEQLSVIDDQLLRAMTLKIEFLREACRSLAKRLADPGRKLRENQQRLDDLSVDLMRRFQDRLREFRDRLVRQADRLNALSPLAVLERGYSITHKLPEETIVKDSATLTAGDLVRVTFAAGKARCRVEDKE